MKMDFRSLLAGFVFGSLLTAILALQFWPAIECEDSDGVHWRAGTQTILGRTTFVCHIFRSRKLDPNDPTIPEGAMVR